MSEHFTPVTLVQPCPPHQWAHASTVGYFLCMNCRKQVNHDDPEYAKIMADRDARLAALTTRSPKLKDDAPNGPHGGPPVPTVPPPHRTTGDRRSAAGILRNPRPPEAALNMCAHGADRGTYCGYCGGYSQGDGRPVPVVRAKLKDNAADYAGFVEVNLADFDPAQIRRDAVERVARALYEHWVSESVEDDWVGWERLRDKETWRGRALAAIAALSNKDDEEVFPSAPKNLKDDEVAALRNALERIDRNFWLLLEGKPVRDVAETKAEVQRALAMRDSVLLENRGESPQD